MEINNRIIVADSSALVSLASVNDSNYQLAVGVSEKISRDQGLIILSGEIFAETINTIGKKIGHTMAVGTASEFLDTNKFLIAETTPDVRKKALEKFEKQPEAVSFTDCLVMVFADRYETKEIFGFDEVFKKNGYKRLGLD